jgi:predicted dehydrogenase
MEFKYGIIGFGKIGQLRKHIIEELNIGTVIAISDPYADLSNINSQIFTTSDYTELLKKELNCVVVATPNNVTAQAIIDSLEAGKHVFSEKPPGRNLAEVFKIRDMFIKNQHLRLKFGFNHREHYSVREAKKIINNGTMGRLMWVRGLYGKAGSETFEKEWRSLKNVAGGGILLDQGIHMIDLLNYFMGDFTEVKSFVTKSFWNIPLEDNAFAILKNDNDQHALFHSSSTQWKHLFRLELYFTEGYMTLSGLLTGSKSYGNETLIVAKRNFDDAGKPMEEEIYFDEDRSWYFEMQNFYDSLTQDKPIIQGSIDDAIKAMELVEKIYTGDPAWQAKLKLEI